jgi:hypothetical protein
MVIRERGAVQVLATQDPMPPARNDVLVVESSFAFIQIVQTQQGKPCTQFNKKKD